MLLATGQEIVPALGRPPEMSTVEPALPQVTNKHSQGMQPPARSCEVFEEEVWDIAQDLFPDLTSLPFCNPSPIIVNNHIDMLVNIMYLM